MKSFISPLLAVIFFNFLSAIAVAENSIAPEVITRTITATEYHHRFKISLDSEDLHQTFEDAVTEQGLLSRGIMHIHEMLQRTGKDLNQPDRYKHAAAIEFCSAEITHLMTAANPVNFAICPYTISYYETLTEPGILHIVYHIPELQGTSEKVAIAREAIEKMYDAIIQEATFYF